MRIFLYIIMLLVAGCEPLTGNIRRSTQLDSPPSINCIDSVLRNNIDEITEVHFERREGGRPLNITGIHKPDDIYNFMYKGKEIWGQLLLSIDYKGEVYFSQSHGYIGMPPDLRALKATRPVMIKIEKELQNKCHIKNLTTKIIEKCHGIKCL